MQASWVFEVRSACRTFQESRAVRQLCRASLRCSGLERTVPATAHVSGWMTLSGVYAQNRGPMADYSGCRSRNTRGVFPAPSSCHRFLGVWSTPGKYFRGGTLLLSNETVANRRLHSEPSMSTTANFSTILADVEASYGRFELLQINPRSTKFQHGKPARTINTSSAKHVIFTFDGNLSGRAQVFRAVCPLAEPCFLCLPLWKWGRRLANLMRPVHHCTVAIAKALLE